MIKFPIAQVIHMKTISRYHIPTMSQAMGQSMGPSIRQQNKEYLLEVILNQLGLNHDDLEKEPHLIKSIVRDSNIDKVLEND